MILGRVVWNNYPLSLRTGDPSDSFTIRNGNSWSNGQVFYSNLPSSIQSRFPMWGPSDVDSGNDNVLVLKTTVIAYLLRNPDWGAIVPLEGWRLMSSGKYLGPTETSVNLYEKVIRKGTYVIDNYSAMYLFSDELYGKFQSCYMGEAQIFVS